MQTRVAPRGSEIIPEIARRLEAGEVAIVPTGTLYALIANAYNEEAVARLRELKREARPQPLTIFTRSDKVAEVAELDPVGEKLLARFPLPAILIARAKPDLPESITSGFDNIFLACPDRFIHDLIGAVSFPIACSSASLSSEFKATHFDAAWEFFEGEVPLIVDGGKSEHEQGGTLIDLTAERPQILRFGPISADDLRPIVPEIELPSHMRK